MMDTWTHDRVERLTALWADGHSAQQIANKLGLHSRSMVVGKVRRLDLPEPLKKLAWFQRITRVKAKRAFLAPRPLNDLAERSLHIAFIDLESHHCRYPYGDEPASMTFCGHSKTDGSSYCPEHRSFTCQVVSA